MWQRLTFVGTVIAALVAAISFSFNFFNIIPNAPWTLVAMISYAAFVVLAGRAWYAAEQRVKQLQDSRPSITVQPVKQGDTYFLKVHNTGAEGLFIAQFQLESDDLAVRCLPNYVGFWKNGNRGEARILRGHYDFIKIAEVTSSPPSFRSLQLGIWFFDSSVNYAHPVNASCHWIGATISSPDGKTIEPLPKHKYKIRVSISSSPELITGTYVEQYVLTVSGLETHP